MLVGVIDRTGKDEPAAWIELDAGSESQALPIERLLHPIDVLPRGAAQLEVPDLKRDCLERGEVSGRGLGICEIHERQVAAIFFAPPDTFIIIEEIAATIENEPLMVDLDGLRVMRRMAVNDRHIALSMSVRAKSCCSAGISWPQFDPQ